MGAGARTAEGMAYANGLLYDGGTVAADAFAIGLLKGRQWAQGLTYVVGELVFVGARGSGVNVYRCTVGGTAPAAGTGPSGTGTNLTDGSGGTERFDHISQVTYAQLNGSVAEPSAGGYARKALTSANAVVAATGVMTMGAVVTWGTGVTSIVGCELWFTTLSSKFYAWGWLDGSRTLTTADTMTESITDTPS